MYALDLIVQLCATALLLYGLYHMGNEKLRGPVLASASEVLWVGVGLWHSVLGLVLLSTILAVMQGRNAVKWRGKPW